MVTRTIFAIIFLALISGCSNPPEPVIKTVTVEVPVAAKCPTVPSRDYPELPISSLTANSKYDEIVKAYTASIIILKNEVEWYKTLTNKGN